MSWKVQVTKEEAGIPAGRGTADKKVWRHESPMRSVVSTGQVRVNRKGMRLIHGLG